MCPHAVQSVEQAVLCVGLGHGSSGGACEGALFIRGTELWWSV